METSKEYIRPMPATWWLTRKTYFLFMVRELTCVFVGGYLVFLLVWLYHLGAGKQQHLPTHIKGEAAQREAGRTGQARQGERGVGGEQGGQGKGTRLGFRGICTIRHRIGHATRRELLVSWHGRLAWRRRESGPDLSLE